MFCAYLALVWNNNDQAATERASRLLNLINTSELPWICKCAEPGMYAFGLDEMPDILVPYVLAGRGGVVFGRLFSRSSFTVVRPASVVHDCTFAHQCVSSKGDYLVQNFWGTYVAILTHPESGSATVVRDCSGMMPCYYTTVDGVTVICADVKYLEMVGLRPCLNRGYVAAFLAMPHLQIAETALAGVAELLAGQSLQISRGKPKTCLAWDPVSVCSSDIVRDPTLASQALREATQSCVDAWASLFRPRILHTLSGGFDSSIVLSAVLRAPVHPDLLCVNRYSGGAGEDERPYARLAARACGVELVELMWHEGTQPLDERCLSAPRVAKPTVPYLCALAEAPFWNLLCSVHGAAGIWTGQGGDHLFMSAKTSLGVLDAIQVYGLGSYCTSAIWDAAVLTGHSVWHVMNTAARAAFDRTGTASRATIPLSLRFLNPESLPAAIPAYTAHPWDTASIGLPPGKRYQLLLLSDLLNRHRPLPGIRSTEDFHPLLSQPLIETALRIPVPLLLTGGKTRGLARLAFAEYAPPEILNRELKGQTSTYTLSLIRNSIRFVRELLLDGLLVGNGILSRTALADVLQNDFPIETDAFFPLFACVAAEIWARCWNSIPINHSRDSRLFSGG